MSHPAQVHRIAINLLLPPVSLESSIVASAMGIPYQTIYKWKKDALSAQVGKKRQGKSTTTIPGLKRAARIKKDPNIATSQPIRMRTRPNKHIHVSPTRGGYAEILKRLAEDY